MDGNVVEFRSLPKELPPDFDLVQKEATCEPEEKHPKLVIGMKLSKRRKSLVPEVYVVGHSLNLNPCLMVYFQLLRLIVNRSHRVGFRYIFREWRSFLIRYSHYQDMVYPNQAYGPAASLKVYIKQIGWSVGDKGQICDHLMCVWTIHKDTFTFFPWYL